MIGLMHVYDHLPVFAQNVACSWKGAQIQKRRFGAGFYRMLDEFESHLAWDESSLVAWQEEKLQALLKHSYENVPYWHNLFDRLDIDYRDLRRTKDLKVLPPLTKQMINENPNMFLARGFDRSQIVDAHTSGTTGSGLRFPSTLECRQAQFACFWRFYRQHGLTLNTWQAEFASQPVVPQHVANPPFWRIDKPGRRYYMSAFHESPKNMEAYWRIIKERRFEWISGYPSLMVLLAQWMNERGLSYDFVRVVTTGAENLLDHQKAAIERAFGVAPVETYGQTENVAIFSQQLDGRVLVDEDFSLVEFEPSDTAGGLFNVLGTCLFNYAMPFIRYRTNDVVTLGGKVGWRREVASIDGRSEDYLVLPDGTRIGKLDHVFKDTTGFREAQIYQAPDYSVILRVVGEPYLCEGDERTALAILRQSIGDVLPVRFEYCSEIPRTSSQKLRFVVCNVDRDNE